jgi:hypothetical protein
LRYICNLTYTEDAKTIAQRTKNQNDVLSKKKIISFQDLMDHVGRVKFTSYPQGLKDQYIKEIKDYMVHLFPKADLLSEEPTLTDTDMMKNKSKVM